MFKGISPKQMKKIAKQMGVKMEEVEALEVVIKLNDRELVFEKPQVTITKVMGQNTFQIAGDYVEKSREI
ncbi:MAG: NAC domain-containing protein, partial [Candidatus Methanofastidiosia archaeon]